MSELIGGLIWTLLCVCYVLFACLAYIAYAFYVIGYTLWIMLCILLGCLKLD